MGAAYALPAAGDIEAGKMLPRSYFFPAAPTTAAATAALQARLGKARTATTRSLNGAFAPQSRTGRAEREQMEAAEQMRTTRRASGGSSSFLPAVQPCGAHAAATSVTQADATVASPRARLARGPPQFFGRMLLEDALGLAEGDVVELHVPSKLLALGTGSDVAVVNPVHADYTQLLQQQGGNAADHHYEREHKCSVIKFCCTVKANKDGPMMLRGELTRRDAKLRYEQGNGVTLAFVGSAFAGVIRAIPFSHILPMGLRTAGVELWQLRARGKPRLFWDTLGTCRMTCLRRARAALREPTRAGVLSAAVRYLCNAACVPVGRAQLRGYGCLLFMQSHWALTGLGFGYFLLAFGVPARSVFRSLERPRATVDGSKDDAAPH